MIGEIVFAQVEGALESVVLTESANESLNVLVIQPLVLRVRASFVVKVLDLLSGGFLGNLVLFEEKEVSFKNLEKFGHLK